MPQRPGGMDPLEIRQALQALSGTRSLDNLTAALDTVPALSSPILHAILRQQYLELRNTKSPHLEHFAPRYRDLFMLLHDRAHRALVAAARASSGADATESRQSAPHPFAPPFLSAVLATLAGRLPANDGGCHNLDTDLPAFVEEVRSLCGQPVSLPPHAPTAGATWALVKVGCPVCGRERLDARAYAVDLVVATELVEAVRHRRVNNMACEQCGGVLCYPIRVWAFEAPGPSDSLEALACVWRLAPEVFSYQPPPGTKRNEGQDRILEIRFQQQLGLVTWPDIGERAKSGAVQTTISVSYSIDELLHYLDRAVPRPGELPFAMETMVREMSRKVQSGILPLHQAIEAVLHDVPLVGADWPVASPGAPRQFQGPPLAHLFHSVIAEGVARARALGPDAEAVFACGTSSSLLAMGEGALSEAALARADDSLARAPGGRQTELATLMAIDMRADLYEFLGRYDDAAALRAKLRNVDELQADNWMARLTRQGMASQQALALYKTDRIADAFVAFKVCINAWEALLEEARSADPQAAGSFVPRMTHSLSGDLANLAGMLMTLTDDLKVYQIAAMDLPPEEKRALILAEHPDPAAAMARIENGFDELEREFGGSLTRAALSAAAEQLLRRALALSEQVEGWEFAGVQAHRLGVLRVHAGDPDDGERFVEKAVRYAARAGDHERIWTGRALLADRALHRQDGPAALAQLEAAARELIRQQVGLGIEAGIVRGIEALSDGAFRAVALGGDAAHAVMIVESLRAASTAASISTGTPFQLAGLAIPESLSRLTAERERLRLRLIWSPEDEHVAANLDRVRRDLADEQRRLSLRDPRYGRWVDASDIDVAPPDALFRRLAQLGHDSLWLGAIVAGDRLWSYAASAGTATVSGGPVPAVLREAGRRDGSEWTDAALTELGDALLAPHTDRIDALDPDAAVVISVSAALQAVPIAALPWRGRRFCEIATAVRVQGFGMFEAAVDRPRLPSSSFLILGAPKRPDVDPLPGSAKEIETVAQVLREAGREVTVLAGPRATATALAGVAGDHDVLHLSCHAVAASTQERASRLLLSPDTVKGDSGDLSEERIVSELLLRSGALVNLAGCSTALTRETNGPLLGGLVPAFLVGGAGCVIGSLWAIADQPAACLQTEFYRALTAGARPAAALAAAQRLSIAGALGPEMMPASVWAAYAANGAG